MSDPVTLADAQYYDFVHPVSVPLSVAQPQQPLFPPKLYEAEKEFYDVFYTMKTKLDIVVTYCNPKPRRGSLFLFLCKEPTPLIDAWDIPKCLKAPKKPVGVVVVDNCVSDGLGPSGHVAFHCFGMMSLHVELDVLIVTSYAPHRSFRNMVQLLFGWIPQSVAENVISEDPDAAMLLAFIRCSKDNCPCAKRAWRAKRFPAELDHWKGLRTPIPHPKHADHFLSYGEHRGQRLNADPNTHQPSFAKCPGRCTLCRYVLKSENDKAVHNRLRHHRSGSLLNE